MAEKKFIPYAHQNINQDDIDFVSRALSQSRITRGTLVADFEAAFAKECEASYAVAFNSGTAALMAAYFAGEVGVNDTILTTPNTFVSTVGAGIQRGAKPIFIDIDRKTGNIDLENLLHNVNPQRSRGKTAIVPIHFAGIPVDMQAIDGALHSHETILIEDAAHALGSRYKSGEKVGSCAWSHMTVFSFHPAKTITTGEGGMVTTNDPHLDHRLRLFRDNGIERDPNRLKGEAAPWHYEVETLAGNYNFTEMQAALGLSQLKRLDQFIAKRQRLLDLYKRLLGGIENVRVLAPAEEMFIAPHLCAVHIDFAAFKTTRKAVMEALLEKGFGTQYHYIPVYRHPFFVRQSGDISEHFPEMERHFAEALSLPLYFDLTEEEVESIVTSLVALLK